MQKNLGPLERGVRLLLGVFALFAAAVLFKNPFARVAVGAFGVYSLWECAAAKCPLHASLGIRAPGDRWSPERLYLLGLAAVQATMAYEWWSAGWEKVSNPDFVANIGKTLGSFASKNPFPWYKAFLEGFAAPNGTVFAYAVEWSQIGVALALVVCAALLLAAKDERSKRAALVISLVALVGGMGMNANFYLAAGWTGAGTKGSNVVMFWTQAALLYVWLSSLRTADRTPAATPLPL